MKKIFKSKRISNLIFCTIGIISGVVIGGIVGVTATTNKLEAKYVMYTKDGETMTVQDAIKDLYVLAKNNGGNTEVLPLGEVTVKSLTIKVPYIGTYKDIKCLYGTDESYGKLGSINSNICTFMGTSGNQDLYYKIIASNDDGRIYETSGNITTGSETNVIKTDIPTGTKAIIYLDPTDLSKTCNESNSTSTTGIKSGCMKWYAFIEDDASYTMILDHNTYAKGTWGNTKSELTTLQGQIGWKELNTRMISGQEIADITGNTSWTTSSTSDKWFYLDSNTQTQTATSTGASDYYWLFDYTAGCTSYGCKVADSSTYGYWTDTARADSSTDAWCVGFDDALGSGSVGSTFYGLRPVITVPKSNF